VAIGYNAGQTNQRANAVAIGYSAGQSQQGTHAVAIGFSAGSVLQSSYAVAIGYEAGFTGQGEYCVAVGRSAGIINQKKASIGIGKNAGRDNQGEYSVAIGFQAGQQLQAVHSVAVGSLAGYQNQSSNVVAIGWQTGKYSQGYSSVAIGAYSAFTNQSTGCIAIGAKSASTNQQMGAIAIGYRAGQAKQGTNAIAIGYNSGASNALSQYPNSICIGAYSVSTQNSSIVLNASTNPLAAGASDGFYVSPMGFTDNTFNVLVYITQTNEIAYNTSGKTFVIDHPKDPERLLVHACLEGPEGGVYYRGEGKIKTGEKSVEIVLPYYVTSLANEFSVQVTPIYDHRVTLFGGIFTSRVVDGRFSVYSEGGTEFFWLVQGKRCHLNVEPFKKDVVVKGEGPYRWI